MHTPSLMLDLAVTPAGRSAAGVARTGDAAHRGGRVASGTGRRPEPADTPRGGEDAFRTRLDKAQRSHDDRSPDESRPVSDDARSETTARESRGRAGSDEKASETAEAASEAGTASSDTDAPDGKDVGVEADADASGVVQSAAGGPENGENADTGPQDGVTAGGTGSPVPATTAGTDASIAAMSAEGGTINKTAGGNRGDAPAVGQGTARAAPGAPSLTAAGGHAGGGTEGTASRPGGTPGAGTEVAPGSTTRVLGPAATPLRDAHAAEDAAGRHGAGNAAPSDTPSKTASTTEAPAAVRTADATASESPADGASSGATADGDASGQGSAFRRAAAMAQADRDTAARQAAPRAAEAPRPTTVPAEPSTVQPSQATAGGRAGAAAQQTGGAAARLSDAADQVAESIRATGGRAGRQVTVHLNPPELGRVRIALESEGDSIRGSVRVDVPETLSRLQQEAAPLMQRLQAEGIDLKRLDVTLNQEQTGGQGEQDAAFGQGRSDPDAWQPGASGEVFASADGEAAAADPATDGPDDAVAAAGRPAGSINVQA